jgi:molecular chaperone GrpE
MKEDKKKKHNPDPTHEAPSTQPLNPMDDAQTVQPGQTPSPDGGLPMDGTSETVEVTPAASVPQAPLIGLTLEEYDTIQKDLEKSRSQATNYFEGWQRERADFLNYKKRVERDAVMLSQNALTSVVKKYLVILDDLDRALKTRSSVDEGAGWSEGIDLIYRKLLNMLENEGVRRMEMTDDVFDPNRHEAITYEESPAHQSGQIIEVIQPGYLLGERVIRPAQVRVAK